MKCRQCEGIEQHFDDRVAADDHRHYRKNGPDKTTALLIKRLREAGVEGKTLLDIGSGVGAIQFELLESGLRSAVGVDASRAYIRAANQEAAHRGLEGRIREITGDFVDIAGEVPEADVVTLDRVICCYHDAESLVKLSASHAKRFYAASYPRSRWWVRIALVFENLLHKLNGTVFRTYAHSVEEIEKWIEEAGFRLRSVEQTIFWRVVIFERVP